MRAVLILLLPLWLLASGVRMHEAPTLMDWDRAVAYCHQLDAHVPTIKDLKNAYYGGIKSRHGQHAYLLDDYWSSDLFDMSGAYVFDFSTGLHRVEWRGNTYRVMCIQADSLNY